MIEKAAKGSNVSLTPKETQDKVDEALKRSGVKSVEDLLNTYKVTWYRFMDANRINGLAEKAVQKNLRVTDAEYAGYIKARHILVRPPQDEADKAKADEAAKKKIDEVYAKVKAGEDFAALADEYTEDPSNVDGDTKKGGDLGWFTRGRMVQDFENAAFKLKAGEISEPVKTFYGYHIIRVETVGKDASPAEKSMLKAMILEQKLPAETGRWYSDLMAKTKMDNKLMQVPPPQPAPVVRPQPAPRPAPAPAPKPEAKPAEPASPEKPDTPPPPPPPAQ
jgi:foldase protein PrsA